MLMVPENGATEPGAPLRGRQPAAVSPLLRQEERAPSIVAVTSGKGGVGKTWLSVTLCHALARAGDRVLLFDAHLGLANVDVQLGLVAERDLSAVLGGTLTLERAVFACPEGGFDIIAGWPGAGPRKPVSKRRMAAIGEDLVGLSGRYDVVVMDMSAGPRQEDRALASLAGTILIVMNAEPTSITDTFSLLKQISQIAPDAAPRIVVNAVDRVADGWRAYDVLRNAVESLLGYSPALAGVVRRDPAVHDAVQCQTALLSLAPDCPAAVDMAALAARMPVSGDTLCRPAVA